MGKKNYFILLTHFHYIPRKGHYRPFVQDKEV